MTEPAWPPEPEPTPIYQQLVDETRDTQGEGDGERGEES